MGGMNSKEDKAEMSLPQGKFCRFGWRRDKIDARDHMKLINFAQLKDLPAKVDLRNEYMPAVYDQGALGSCTANSICGAFEYCLKKESLADFMPSRLFVYYNEREMEGNVDTDAGAELRDGMKTVNAKGVCHEDDWPYDIDSFTKKPDKECYLSAKGNKCVKYERVSQKPDHLKAVLNEGAPVCFGFLVHESFESDEVAKTGVMPMPGSETEDPVLGGHAVLVVGYDDDKKAFIIRNSWGSKWGQEGYFYMPYDFISNHNECNDFWAVQLVSEDGETETSN